MPNDNFSKYLNNEKIKCEKYLQNKYVYDKFPETIDDEIIDCYEKLAVIYTYFDTEVKAKKMIQHLIAFGYQVYTSRFATLSEEGKKNNNLLVQQGKWQLREGLCFPLAHTDPQKATQLFEWAAENCLMPDEYIAGAIKYENYNHIAIGHLWRGYALLNLGNYDEAYDLLTQVVPYFNKYKKSGGEVWQKVEYALPKALIPLCEYKFSNSLIFDSIPLN